MRKTVLLAMIGLGVGVLAAVSCRRSDIRTAVIDVPQMADSRAIRIVTNAALDEVVGQYDDTQNRCEIDLSKGIVLYHESQNLQSPAYQRLIEARIREVGFEVRVVGSRLNPPPLVLTDDGPIQLWPNRFTAVIMVPDMKTATDANIVVDAIAYARIGGDDPRVVVKRDSRRVIATYESIRLSFSNIEYAIACVGFDANTVPANLGREDSIPHGWTPVTLADSRKKDQATG